MEMAVGEKVLYGADEGEVGILVDGMSLCI